MSVTRSKSHVPDRPPPGPGGAAPRSVPCLLQRYLPGTGLAHGGNRRDKHVHAAEVLCRWPVQLSKLGRRPTRSLCRAVQPQSGSGRGCTSTRTGIGAGRLRMPHSSPTVKRNMTMADPGQELPDGSSRRRLPRRRLVCSHEVRPGWPGPAPKAPSRTPPQPQFPRVRRPPRPKKENAAKVEQGREPNAAVVDGHVHVGVALAHRLLPQPRQLPRRTRRSPSTSSPGTPGSESSG